MPPTHPSYFSFVITKEDEALGTITAKRSRHLLSMYLSNKPMKRFILYFLFLNLVLLLFVQDSRAQNSLEGHTNTVESVPFSQDGTSRPDKIPTLLKGIQM